MTLDGFGLGALAGFVAGAAAAGLVARSLFRALTARWREESQRRAEAEAAASERGLDETADTLREAFRALSADALDRVDVRLRELSREAAGGQAVLGEQMRSLAGASAQLAQETSELARALRSPQGRGRWGELQLRRVVELAGMVERCDFVEQEAVAGRLRPDLVVRLPGGRHVVVDAKTPLSAYLEAVAAGDEASRQEHLAAHARAVRAHMRQLAAKEYHQSVAGSAELVVMFLPGEAFFAAALEADPTLIEAGAAERVVLATPTTLIALLRAVAHGWRHEQAAANAREVAALGRELHERLRTLATHFAGVHEGLESAMESYARAAGVLEARVLAPARRLGELGVAQGAAIAPLPGASPIAALAATSAPGASASTGTSR